MNHQLARIFRSLNARLVYVRSRPIEILLKVPFKISEYLYRNVKQVNAKQQWLTIVVDQTLKMKVDVTKAMGRAFYWMGFHELNEWRYLNTFLKPDMVIADIGANQGEFTLFSAKRLKYGRVISFEPMKAFFELLNFNINLNGFKNIQAFNYGLSDRNDEIPIYMGPEGANEHEGLGSIFQIEGRQRFVEQIKVKVFDEVIPGLNISRLDFMKIDVEGAELMVLKGADKTISKYKPVIMLEINENTYKAAGYSTQDVIRFFDAFDYNMYIISYRGKLIKPNNIIPPFCNAVFIPNTYR